MPLIVILALAVVALVMLNLLYLSMPLIVPLSIAAISIAIVCVSGAFCASKIATCGSIGQFANALTLTAYVTAWLVIVAVAYRVSGYAMSLGKAERTSPPMRNQMGQLSQ